MRLLARKMTLFLGSVIALLTCTGADVRWNYFATETFHPESTDTYELCVMHHDTQEGAYVFLVLTSTFYLDSYMILSTEPVMEMCGNFLVMSVGDIVDASTTRRQSSYFMHQFLDDNEGRSEFGNPVLLDKNDSLYLGFAVSMYYDQSKVKYGWMEIGIGSNGQLELKNSLIDLDGDPLVVGVIPEPSAGMLFVVGSLPLLLRRRKMTRGFKPKEGENNHDQHST